MISGFGYHSGPWVEILNAWPGGLTERGLAYRNVLESQSIRGRS